ncbi:protein kinase family protein [Sutcliffiella horikoshii]|uniref:Protein kinase family protein n=1 Tax=Sutcliffiella horikoshii TaxID=79883 RepID=A0A5D4SND3_9BACI|nr:protein kinase family protein [Sutcliffiella horikoshii]TYS64549.1 protein kinase family protein [Sutcliffiella horikoshii]
MRGTTEIDISYQQLADSVVFKRTPKNVVVDSFNDQQLTIAGSGRSAYVFKLKNAEKVLKVFYPPFEHLAKREAKIYDKLKGIPFFPVMHASGENYIVIDFIEGSTLFECLVMGKHIEENVLKEVDHAILLAKNRGLNPSDIHLHNILINPDGKVKLIDVVRFEQDKHCTQWNDLKRGYYKYYKKRIFPKKLPSRLLLLIAYFYKRDLLNRFVT